MINYFLTSISILFVVFTMSSCGGGGGGGSSSSGSNSESVLQGDTRTSNTGIRLLNGAIDSAPVDLRTDAQVESLTTTRFSLPAGFAAVSKATQNISVVPTKKLAPFIFSQPVTLANNEHLTILVYGNNESLGLRAAVLPDTRPAELNGQAAIRIIHATNSALTLGSTIDGLPLADGIPFGGASDYVPVSAGTHSLSVSRASDSLPLFSGSVALEGGRSYSLFVTGEAGYLVVGRLLED